jgi:predicted transcriptional regulator
MRTENHRFSERELDIMQALWALKEGTVAQIHGSVTSAGIDLAYTTVQTMLNRLELKGAVERDTEQRAHVYRPRTKEPSTVGRAIDNLTQRFFAGSLEALVARLVEKDLTAKQIENIRSLIESKDVGGTKQ